MCLSLHCLWNQLSSYIYIRCALWIQWSPCILFFTLSVLYNVLVPPAMKTRRRCYSTSMLCQILWSIEEQSIQQWNLSLLGNVHLSLNIDLKEKNGMLYVLTGIYWASISAARAPKGRFCPDFLSFVVQFWAKIVFSPNIGVWGVQIIATERPAHTSLLQPIWSHPAQGNGQKLFHCPGGEAAQWKEEKKKSLPV